MKSLSLVLIIFLFTYIIIDSAKAQEKFIGKKAPELSIEKFLQAPKANINWKNLNGNVVVLEFWATWCAPCVASIPHINELVDEFRNEPVKFISVTDDNEEILNRFLKKKKIKYWIGIDSDRSLFKALNVIGIPKTFIIDKSGIIAAAMHPNQLSAEVIKSILNEKKNLSSNKTNSLKVIKSSSNKKNEIPEYEFKIIKTDKQKFPSYAYNSSIGKFNSDAIPLHEVLSLLYDYPTYLIFGPDSILDNWYKIDFIIPRYRAKQFSSLLKKYISDAFDIKVTTDSLYTNVYYLNFSGKKHLLIKSKDTEKFHLSSVPGIILGRKVKMDELISTLQSVLNKPIIDETNLDSRYDWHIEYDKGNLESLKKELQDNYGLIFSEGRKKIKVLKVEK